MQISILNVAAVTKNNKMGKPMQILEVAYKNLTFGKVDSKQLFSFGAQEGAYKALQGAASGEVFEVDVMKNAAGFNDWVKVTPSVPGTVPAGAPAAQGSINNKPGVVVKSTYETPLEREAKQRYIVKQSSISNAIELLSIGAKSPPDIQDVLVKAQTFYNWVFQSAAEVVQQAVKQDLMTMDNDMEVE